MLKLRFNLVADAGNFQNGDTTHFSISSYPTKHFHVSRGCTTSTPKRSGNLPRNEWQFGDNIICHHSFHITPSINEKKLTASHNAPLSVSLQMSELAKRGFLLA